MKRVILQSFITFLFYIHSFSQGQDKIWIFGSDAGIDFNDSNNPLPFKSETDVYAKCSWDENNSCISDSAGNLVMYFHYDSNYQVVDSTYYLVGGPSSIFNRNYDVIENGDSIYSSYTWTNGSIILQKPLSTNLFYLIYVGGYYDSSQNYVSGIFYALVDMNYNNWEGKCVEKNILLYEGNLTEKVSAVKHANGKDWWVYAHESNNQNYYRFLLTQNGIAYNGVQFVGCVFHSDVLSQFGELVFSPSGNYACNVGVQYIDFFKFDRCNGWLMDYVPLENVAQTVGGNSDLFYSCAFSPNERYLYVVQHEDESIFGPAAFDYIYQYDLYADNIKDSRCIIYTEEREYYDIAQMELAPDGKIYISMTKCLTEAFPPIFTFETQNLSLINLPNNSCGQSGFGLYNFPLVDGTKAIGGLPNMPNHNLGAIMPPTVDAGVGMTICKGESGMLNGFSCAGCVYDWQPAESLSNAKSSNPFASPTITTTYTLTVTDTLQFSSCNKTSTDTVTIFVLDKAPAIQSLYIVSAGDEFFFVNDLQPNSALEVININGQRVYKTENYQNDLGLKNLAAGMYYYKMELPDCYEVAGKFVLLR